MTDSTNLIMQKIESKMLAALPRARPDAVFVLSYSDGTVRTFHHAPGILDRAGSKWCFVVDRSQRISHGELRLPAYGGVDYFRAWYDAAWQVSDPEALVRANLTDGDPVVSGFLKGVMWPMTRTFDPGDVRRAEDALVAALQPPQLVGSGLTLNGLTLRLAPDSSWVDTTAKFRDEDERQRLIDVRHKQLQRLLPGLDPLVMMQLATDPNATEAALQRTAQTGQLDRRHQLDVLDRLLAHNILTDVDGDALRGLLPGLSNPTALPGTPSTQQALPPPPPTPAVGWGATPVLGAPPAAGAPALTSGPTPSLPTAPPQPSAPPVAHQVPATGGYAVPAHHPAPPPTAPRDQPVAARPVPAQRPPAPHSRQADARPEGAGHQPQNKTSGDDNVVRWRTFQKPTRR